MESSVDLISELPVCVLHQILSCLSKQDLSNTFLLSKQWYSVRKSFPVLEFLQPPAMECLPVHGPQFKDQLRQLLGSVDRSLQSLVRSKLCIERLNLFGFRVDYDSLPLVDTWLPTALHNGVLDLLFYVNVASEENVARLQYPLSDTSFALNSAQLAGSSRFFRLEKLTLVMVCLSEHIVGDIIKNSRSIRALSLQDISGLKTLNISKLDKLASLTVSFLTSCCNELKSISVDALSLEHFSFSSRKRPYPRCCEIDLSGCSNLRKLELFRSSVTDAQFHRQISRFPLLESLDISSCHRLRRIEVSLQRLSYLRVFCCRGVRAIKFDSPALSIVDFTDDDDRFPTIVLSQLSFDPDNPRKAVNPPPVEVGCFDLTDLSIDSDEWGTFLDALLSSCHPRMVSMTADRADTPDDDNFVEIMCKMLSERCGCGCGCKCWRHRLKDAKIESIGSDGEIEDEHALSPFLSIPCDSKIRFKLDWDLSGIQEGLEFLERLSLSSS